MAPLAAVRQCWHVQQRQAAKPRSSLCHVHRCGKHLAVRCTQLQQSGPGTLLDAVVA